MSIAIQKSLFGQDKFLGDTRQKLAVLCSRNPRIAESEKRVILEYWKAYEGLAQVLEDRLNPFISWFFKATSPETITRCLRAIKEDGTIVISSEQARHRQEREQEWI